MKHILLSIAACASFSCFGAANSGTADKRAADVVPRQITIHDIIKVSASAESRMQCDVAFSQRCSNKVMACLIADERVPKDAAQQLLSEMVPLKLSAVRQSVDQYAKMKAASTSAYKWACIFVIERMGDGTYGGDYLYMRILNKKASHIGKLTRSLYCKLTDSEPHIEYEESGMAAEIWKDANTLAADELGFEVDIVALRKSISNPTLCTIL
jgi:hypothetical protein